MGISYGTWVAQEYARTLPARTDSLILDSIVGPEPPDAFAIEQLRDAAARLREQCARGRCKGATRDFVGDVGKVAAKLHARAAARARLRRARARACRRATRRQSQFYFLVTSGDLNPFMQARLPGAVDAAVRGDLGPLLRLKRIGEGPPSKVERVQLRPERHDGLPRRAAPVLARRRDPATRAPLVESALAAIPPAAYAPWSADVGPRHELRRRLPAVAARRPPAAHARRPAGRAARCCCRAAGHAHAARGRAAR